MENDVAARLRALTHYVALKRFPGPDWELAWTVVRDVANDLKQWRFGAPKLLLAKEALFERKDVTGALAIAALALWQLHGELFPDEADDMPLKDIFPSVEDLVDNVSHESGEVLLGMLSDEDVLDLELEEEPKSSGWY